ncbi:MAG: hypothetical protein MUD01_07415 [Chloroflexaceae bacterium]|jgi:hypothetical protein|nr:hypothetical protein [Chloroflexaceae bacterium]
MRDKQSLTQELIQLLTDRNFADRYYRYYEQCRGRGEMKDYTPEKAMEVLATSGLDVSYDRREKFFTYREKHDSRIIGVNVSYNHSMAELILTLQLGEHKLGGPFPMLARQTALLRDPAFTYEPRSPKLPFSNQQELNEVTRWGVDMFLEIKQAIQASPLWKD